MRNQEKTKKIRKGKNAKQTVENLLAFFYSLRWIAWILVQFRPLAALWDSFLTENSAGVMLAKLFTTGALGTAWNFLVNELMGKTGTLLLVGLLAVDWCYEHFPTTEVNQLINQIRYVRSTPPIGKPIRRNYVRAVYDALGEEALYDIGSFRNMPLNEDGTLQLVMQEGQVMVFRQGQRMMTLPQDRWCVIPEAQLHLKYIMPSYKVQ